MILIKKGKDIVILQEGNLIQSYKNILNIGLFGFSFNTPELAQKAFAKIIRKIDFETKPNLIIDLDHE